MDRHIKLLIEMGIAWEMFDMTIQTVLSQMANFGLSHYNVIQRSINIYKELYNYLVKQ